MFRHYRVILRELVVNTFPSYTNISNAAVGNTIYNVPGHHGSSINIQTVYTATIQTGFMRIVAT